MGDPERIVVVGGSAGAFDEIREILAHLPTTGSVAVGVVLHTWPRPESQLALALGARSTLPVSFAEHDAPLVPGTVVVAPPDRHLIFREGRTIVSSGPTENLHRPSIDVLFRSAAVAHGSRCVGVLLSGQNDDGADGLRAIVRCGGVALIRDPESSPFPRMPQAARRLLGDASVGTPLELAAMLLGALGQAASASSAGASPTCPEDVVKEVDLAQRAIEGCPPAPDALGELIPIACPDCGGTLWRVGNDDAPRYRCHTAHAFTADALAEGQHRELTRALWAAHRMMRERVSLLQALDPERKRGATSPRVEEYERYANHLWSFLDRMVQGSPTAGLGE